MPKMILIVTLLAVGWFWAPLQAENGSAAALYSTALTRERGLREPGTTPSLNDYRAAIAAYEAILRRFPTSSYDDHALWQSAGLAIEAYDRYRQHGDLENGVRLLRTLEHQHPTSPFASRVAERRRQLDDMARLAWLNDVDHHVDDDGVRVTVRLDRVVRFQSEQLDNPPRLFFDFPSTEAAPPLRNATLTFEDDGHDALVRAIRLGRHPQHTTRLVLDVANVEACRTATHDNPFRLVIDCNRSEPVSEPVPVIGATVMRPAAVRLTPAAPASISRADLDGLRFTMFASALQPPLGGLEDLPRPEPLPSFEPEIVSIEVVEQPLHLPIPGRPPSLPATNSTGEFSIARQLGLHASRIVIDPGHGGHDPGARARGLTEADLVLDVAHRLAQRLSTQPGLEVVMTRHRDSYVPLEARTTLANRVQADLFLSIHANASRNAYTRGVETYFLNLATDPAAERLAARENVAGVKTMHDLEGLLHTIATNSKVNESRDFAAAIHGALLDTLRTVDPELPDLGVKQAPFVVLIGARMPSILAEISFVTNRQDATLLSTDAYRDLIADALFAGVLRYQRSLDSAPLVALQVDGEGL